MMQEAPTQPVCEVIILTALPVEYQAVLHYLQTPREIVHPSGTVYHWSTFPGMHRTWRVAVAEIGMGGATAALEAEKAISFFHAQIALFVGIAGGLKDVQRGDVVAATKVYAYEAGKAAQCFEPRPELGHPSHALEQRARAEAHHDEWLARLDGSCPNPAPRVFVGALAAGEKVLSSKQSSLSLLLKNTYGDALAIEMEGHGFLYAVRVNHAVHGLVIRGISDLIDDKLAADASGAQAIAARHAAAFAFQVLAKFTLPPSDSTSSLPARPAVWNVPYARNPHFTGRDELLDRLDQHLTSERYGTHTEIQGWEYVTYDNQRNLGAALAGRSLEPTDVEACPQLPEVTTVLQQLSVTSSAIIKGRSGCGKTITAFQAAYAMHKQGWEVLRLVEPHLSADELINGISNLPQRTVLILDNAQSLDQRLIRHLQGRSGDSLAVIIVSTEDIVNPLDLNAVSIVNSRAVTTLAKAIQSRKKEILPIIQKLDPHIGEGFSDIPLERRIEEAVQCETPWQFSFVLTGGELRTRDILARVREVNRADLLLATIAAGQIVSLDEGVPRAWLERAAQLLGRDKQWLEQPLRMLQKQRVVFGKTYYRCSHLRFSVYTLHFMFEDIKNVEWGNIATMLRGIIAWETTPIRGISWLLRELRFTDTFSYQQKSNTIVTHSNWRQIIERCWKADSGEDRRDAAFVLAELIDWYPDHIQTISDNTSLLAQWIEDADSNSGFALGLLVNSLSQEYRHINHVTETLIKYIDPYIMASKLSQLQWTGVVAWSFLIGRLRVASSQEWRTQFDRSVDFSFVERLIEIMSITDIYAFNTFLENMGVSHTEKALNLIERAIPKLANAFHNNFIEAFKEFCESIWFVLGYAPGFLRCKRSSPSQHRVAKKFANALQPQIVANAISRAAQRDWGSCADMLSFIKEAAPKHAAKIANLINFSQLDETAQGLWERCPHELLQLILSLSIFPNHEPARSWVVRHSDELEEMHSVLAIVTPQIIVEKLRVGYEVPLTLFNSELSLLALRSITAIDSSLATRVFKHNIPTIAKELSELQPHHCQGVVTLIAYLHRLSPAVFTAMIKEIDPAKAKKNWSQCLQGNKESKKTIAVIFTCSQLAEGPITEVISQLKVKYPSASAYNSADIRLSFLDLDAVVC